MAAHPATPTTAEPSSAAPQLRRAVSRWEIVALAVNDVVGSGVYLVLPVATARLLGAASVWAILGVALGILPIVLCYAEAGSRFERPGASYAYARAAFGDFVGFEIGWMTWVSRVSALSSLAVYLARAMAFLGPGSQSGVGLWAATLLPLVALTALNIAGVRFGTSAAVVLGLGKVAPLVLLVGVGLLHVRWGTFLHVHGVDAGRVSQGTLLVLFAFAGFENTAAPASEFKRPGRDVPFALLVQWAVAAGLYFAVQGIVLGAVDVSRASEAPLADAGRALLGPWAAVVMTAGAFLSVLGTHNNTVLTGGRYLFAMAETGELPRALARVHPRFRTPFIALLAQCGLAILLLLTGTAESLAELSAITRVASYASTAAAILVFRRREGDAPFRTPGGPLVPLLALVVCVAFLASAQTKNWIAAAIAAALGAGLFVVGRRRVSL
jgi:APA family basic amino acid/polyamine antiporter